MILLAYFCRYSICIVRIKLNTLDKCKLSLCEQEYSTECNSVILFPLSRYFAQTQRNTACSMTTSSSCLEIGCIFDVIHSILSLP